MTLMCFIRNKKSKSEEITTMLLSFQPNKFKPNISTVYIYEYIYKEPLRDYTHRMPIDVSRENKMREENLAIVRKRIRDVDAK